MNRKYRATAASIALVALALLAISALATPVAAQGTVSIDGPDEAVDADGDFDFTVEMVDSGVGEIAVESSDFDVSLSVVDDAGDSIGAQTDTSVEFIDIDGETSTYTLNVDVTGGSEGDTGTITAANGGNIGDSGVEQTSTSFSVTESSPEFALSNLQPASADVVQGEVITVSGDVENTGDAAGAATVDLTLDGGSSFVDSTTTSELAPGESTTVSFSVDTGAVDAGDYTHGLQVSGEPGTLVTGDLTVSTDPAGIRGTDRTGAVFAPGDVEDVFQGEDIEFTSTLEGVPEGGAQGEVLEDGPIPADQPTGIYSADGTRGGETVTVRQPRVQTVDIINVNGGQVNEVTENEPVLVGVDFNYEEAKFLDMEIIDNAGVDTFNDFNGQADFDDLTDAQEDELSGYDARYALSFDRAGEYEIELAPEDSDFGAVHEVESAVRSEVLTVVSDEDAELELGSDSASQGERIDFEITNGEDGDTYYVGLEIADDRWEAPIEQGNVDPAERSIFRNVGDTEAVGLTGSPPSVNDDFYWAELEIDGTSAIGRIDTQQLDDTSVDIELLEQGATPEDPEFGFGEGEELDEVTLEVEEAEIGISSPSETYVPGMEVDLTGSVSEGVEGVDIFVRDRDNYYWVEGDRTETEGDQYEIDDFDLANDARTLDAQNIVGQPGVYRYGVIDRQDVFLAQLDESSNTDGPAEIGDTIEGAAYAEEGDGSPATRATPVNDIAGANNAGLDSSDFNSGASTQQSLRVAPPSLEAEFRTFGGQVFQDDGIDVSGELIGPRDYVILFTDSRGSTELNDYTSDSDNGEIDEEDIDLIDDLSVGNVRGTVLSPGRDTTFGDGTFTVAQEIHVEAGLPGEPGTNVRASVDHFVDIAEAVGELGFTQGQVEDILLDQTVQDAGSDDLIVTEEFRLSDDSRTEMEEVVPGELRDQLTGIHPIEVGETMVIRGTTNRDFEDATIVVEADDGPSIAELGTEVTDEWETDGIWEVEFEVSEEVEPGNYTLRSDDGERIDEQQVQILAEGTLEEGERLQNEAEQLRQQVEELQGQLESVRSERDELQNQVSELESTNEDLNQQIADLEDEMEGMEETDDTGDGNVSDDEPEEEGQPGFTAVAALVALVAVALLALRRREE